MNKAKKFPLHIILSFVICLTGLLSVGCGRKIEGTYKFKSLSYTESGMLIEVNAGEQFMGMMTLSEDYYTIVLNEDGTVVMTMSAEEVVTETGTWSETEEGKVALTFDEEPVLINCDGKTIELDIDGMKIILEKQK